MGILGFFSKKDKEDLDKGLEKTKGNFLSRVSKALVGKSKVDEALLDELEADLIASDVGVETTIKIIDQLESRVAKDKYLDKEELYGILQEEIIKLIGKNGEESKDPFELPATQGPYVIMVVGVNGVGKTTTIGKLAYKFKGLGKSVLLGAADTFRAAAIDQLSIWAERVDVPIIKKEMGADPAAVCFDTLSAAVSRQVDVVIIDTAGRLHNKVNLMNELGSSAGFSSALGSSAGFSSALGSSAGFSSALGSSAGFSSALGSSASFSAGLSSVLDSSTGFSSALGSSAGSWFCSFGSFSSAAIT